MNESLPPLFRNRNFWLLAFGYFISAVGDNFNDLGQLAMIDALESDKTVRLRALMLFGLFIPLVVLGPVAGFIADRFPRRAIMITADIGRALIVFNFAALIPWLRANDFGDYTVMLTQMSLGILLAFYSPSRQALLPTLVRQSNLVQANSGINALAPIGAMIGFLIGGWVVDNFGPERNFLFNSICYGASAVLILCIHVPRSGQIGSAEHPAPTGILEPLQQGLQYVRQHRRVAQVILLGMIFWATAGAVFACIPAIVLRLEPEASFSLIGTWQVLPAAGMIIGSVLMTIFGEKIGPRRSILLGLVIAGGSLALLAAAFELRFHQWVTMLILLFNGIAGATLVVTIMATLQRMVPNSRRGRIFGVSDMATMGAFTASVGFLALAPIENPDRYVTIFFATAALGMAITIIFALMVKPPRQMSFRHR